MSEIQGVAQWHSLQELLIFNIFHKIVNYLPNFVTNETVKRESNT